VRTNKPQARSKRRGVEEFAYADTEPELPQPQQGTFHGVRQREIGGTCLPHAIFQTSDDLEERVLGTFMLANMFKHTNTSY